MDDKHHEMVLEKTHISGVEEWYCPTCGRRFLVQWPPAYKMIILEQGDKDTRHNVSKANPPLGSFPITRTRKTELSEDFRLTPWLRWMEKVDFDSRWSKNA
ncbi:MAG TPA: hypothetical protein VK249_09095 [Anaerolineales bacterium]|nr:hypothetical protein [Anaerolineales bacterium]